MKISVLTAAYNAEPYLRQLIESVQSQTHSDVEHRIIDDGSTDGTAALLACYPHLTWRSRKNRGQYATQNELLDEATGDVAVVICADDYFTNPKAFTEVASAFSDEPMLDIVLGRTLRKVEGRRNYVVRADVPGTLGVRWVNRALAIQHCSLFLRTSTLGGLRFDEAYRMRGDWDWIIRLFAKARRTRNLGIDVGVWRQHSGQTSQIAVQRGNEETLRLLTSHGIDQRQHQRARMVLDSYAKAARVGAILYQLGPSGLLRR